MKKEMLINVLQPEECRIAIVENGMLEELYVERASQESYVNNIYKGRIVNIEPSIQAAFIDFGIGRNGFLHVSDVDAVYYQHLAGHAQPQARTPERGAEPRGEKPRRDEPRSPRPDRHVREMPQPEPFPQGHTDEPAEPEMVIVEPTKPTQTIQPEGFARDFYGANFGEGLVHEEATGEADEISPQTQAPLAEVEMVPLIEPRKRPQIKVDPRQQPEMGYALESSFGGGILDDEPAPIHAEVIVDPEADIPDFGGGYPEEHLHAEPVTEAHVEPVPEAHIDTVPEIDIEPMSEHDPEPVSEMPSFEVLVIPVEPAEEPTEEPAKPRRRPASKAAPRSRKKAEPVVETPAAPEPAPKKRPPRKKKVEETPAEEPRAEETNEDRPRFMDSAERRTAENEPELSVGAGGFHLRSLRRQ